MGKDGRGEVLLCKSSQRQFPIEREREGHWVVLFGLQRAEGALWRSIHTYRIGKPIEPRKFGYNVMSVFTSIRPYVRTSVRTYARTTN